MFKERRESEREKTNCGLFSLFLGRSERESRKTPKEEGNDAHRDSLQIDDSQFLTLRMSLSGGKREKRKKKNALAESQMCPRSRPLAARQTNRRDERAGESCCPAKENERAKVESAPVVASCHLVLPFIFISFHSSHHFPLDLPPLHIHRIRHPPHSLSLSLTLSHIPLFILLPRLPPPHRTMSIRITVVKSTKGI